MACSDCGSISICKEEYQNVCQECGSVQDVSYLVDDKHCVIGSTFTKFKKETRGEKFKVYQHLYESCVQTLQLSHVIQEEGLLYLPQLWDENKACHFENKKTTITAMLFLLCRSHNYSININEFIKKVMVPLPGFSRALGFVKQVLKLPFIGEVDLTNDISSKVNEIVNNVLKNAMPSLKQNVIDYAIRLSNVVQNKGWVSKGNSRNFIGKIVSSAIAIAIQYSFVLETQPTQIQKRHSKFRVTKNKAINYSAISRCVDLHPRSVQGFVKEIQEKLFEVCREIPWKPTSVTKPSQVGLILKDVLDYVDYSIDNAVEIETDVGCVEKPISMLSRYLIIVAISKQVTESKYNNVVSKDWIKDEYFHQFVLNEYTLFKLFLSESKSYVAIYDTIRKLVETQHPGVDLSGLLSGLECPNILVSQSSFIMSDCSLTYELLEMFKDLLRNSCPVEDILTGNYLSLVQQYLDRTYEDEPEYLEPLTKAETVVYMKESFLNIV